MTFDQSSITNTNTAAYAGSSGTYTGTSSGTYTGTSTTTGSWADSTHSVIWMTRGNVLRGMGLSRQPWGKRIASLVLIAAMMLLAQANLIDVYGGVATWAIAAVPATLLGAIIALAGMLPALRLWWQIVFLAFAQFIIGPVATLSSTTSHYVIPTLKTLSSGWEMTFGSFKYIISVDPPLGTQDGVLMAVWTIGLWLTFFTGVFAINANAWLSLVGVLPLAAAVAVCALLGTDSGWQRAICGIAFALLLIIWLSWRLELLEGGRWISALIIVVLAAGLAFGGTLLVPQDRFVLRDRYDPPLSPYDYTSPLSGMRSYIKDHKKDVLLTVHNLPAGTPVKLAVMDRFDGTVWNLASMIMGMFDWYFQNLYWEIRMCVFLVVGIVAVGVLELIGSYVRKDTVTKVLRILEWAGSIALAAVMVFWLYRQGFCAREYTNYGAIIWPGVTFLTLTLLVTLWRIFTPSAPKEEKLISGLIFLIVWITSLGSNNKLYPSMNNLFLALPYMYWQFYRLCKYVGSFRWKRITISAMPVKCLLGAFFLLFFVQVGLFGRNFAFAEGTGIQDIDAQVTNNETLKGVGMSEERAG